MEERAASENFSIQKGAAYIRVSTDDQLEYSPESQLEEIRSYCLRNHILLSEEHIFIEEEGKSGRDSQNRDSFQRMIAAAKTTPKPFDVIVLWKFSRFARNQDESTFYKSMLRKKLGIDVISVSEPLIEGMYGRLMEMIIEWQDEFYSVNLSAEVFRSMRYKAERGLYNGKMPLGYRKEPDSFPVIVETEAHVVRTIFQLFTAGYDKSYIVHYLNSHGYTTGTGGKFDTDAIHYILENPFYIGKVRWNRRESSSKSSLKEPEQWIIADSHHEPVIDMDTWNAAQKRLKQLRIRSRYSKPASRTRHWLSGIAKCSVCGRTLSYKAGYPHGKNGAVSGEGFQCLGYRKGLHTDSQFISEKKLTAEVLASLRNVLTTEKTFSFSLIRVMQADSAPEKTLFQNELASLERKEKRIREAYLSEADTLEEYKQNKIKLDRRRRELTALLQAAKAPAPPAADGQKQAHSRINSVLDILESDLPNERKAEALRSIIQKIVFYKNTQSLEFHYYLSP